MPLIAEAADDGWCSNSRRLLASAGMRQNSEKEPSFADGSSNTRLLRATWWLSPLPPPHGRVATQPSKPAPQEHKRARLRHERLFLGRPNGQALESS